MELSICVVTFCHLCQLITDLRRCRMYVSFLSLVCLFVVCLFSAFDMKSLFQYSRIFQIFKERDISYQKPRTHKQLTHTRKYVLSCCATKNNEFCVIFGSLISKSPSIRKIKTVVPAQNWYFKALL